MPAASVQPAEPSFEGDTGEDRLSWGLALAGGALIAVFVAAMMLDQAVLAPGSIDVLNFHLPGVAQWIQDGSIWHVDNFLADVAPGNYPNNGDVILLAAVLPWRNDFLSHLAIYPFYALTGLGVYALAAELRAPRPAGVLAGCLLLALPAVAIPALVHSFPDAVLLFAFATGIVFLIRHHRSGRRSELVLAGLALGVALGTKWYGVSSVAVVFAVWAAASLLAGRALRTVAAQGAAIVALVTFAGGVWLLRNWIESGNPFFPVEVAPFGITIFDAPTDLVRELAGFTIADYVGDPGIWGDFILPQYRDALTAAGGLVIVGALAATAALAARWRAIAERGLVAALAACAALLALAYSVTPYTAGGVENMPVLVGADSRYAIPALLVAAALAAWVAGTARRGTIVFGVLALPALVDGIRLASNGENSGAVLEARQWLIAAAAVAFLGAAGWIAWRVWTRLEHRSRRRGARRRRGAHPRRGPRPRQRGPAALQRPPLPRSRAGGRPHPAAGAERQPDRARGPLGRPGGRPAAACVRAPLRQRGRVRRGVRGRDAARLSGSRAIRRGRRGGRLRLPVHRPRAPAPTGGRGGALGAGGRL